MSKYKIEHDLNACIGCGACVSVCPDNWEMDDNGKVRAKNNEIEDICCNNEAKDACPVNCIEIKEEEEK